MEQIKCFNELMKKVFSTKGWWYVVPFAGIGLVFAGLFYLTSPIFMLMDLIRFEMKRLLYKDLAETSAAGQFVILFFFYSVYMSFVIAAVMCIMPLAICYFFAFGSFFISSLGKVKGNPFAFHLLH